MRKNLIPPAPSPQTPPGSQWLDLENLARVELSSEDPAHPIESSLGAEKGSGWLAAHPGPQTIRVVFDAPTRVRRVRLEFVERDLARTQEFQLRWSPDQGESYHEIVRQQFHFDPPATVLEQEEYQVDLCAVTAIELNITPDMARPGPRASLFRLFFA